MICTAQMPSNICQSQEDLEQEEHTEKDQKQLLKFITNQTSTKAIVISQIKLQPFLSILYKDKGVRHLKLLVNLTSAMINYSAILFKFCCTIFCLQNEMLKQLLAKTSNFMSLIPWFDSLNLKSTWMWQTLNTAFGIYAIQVSIKAKKNINKLSMFDRRNHME